MSGTLKDMHSKADHGAPMPPPRPADLQSAPVAANPPQNQTSAQASKWTSQHGVINAPGLPSP